MNSTVQKLNSLVPMSMNTLKNNSRSLNITSSTAGNSNWNTGVYIFIGFVVIFMILFAYYYDAFMNSMQNWTDSISSWLTGRGDLSEKRSNDNIPLAPPIAPQDESSTHPSGLDAVVEKVLPPAKEVFTVSKNDYSYYDAAPLCKALGAELATYDQVKHAWQQGADWCNYGWVKGQMAVYPTQKSTYEELQQGPDDQKGACGKPGLNGGYFDNPELKFGVTCVGKRPTQSQHDATAITSGSTRPLTSSGLVFEQKVQQFKEGSDTLGILPFNKEHWGS